MTKSIVPRFRLDLRLHGSRSDESREFVVVEDPAGGKFFRLNVVDYELLTLLDGRRSVTEAVADLAARGLHVPLEDAERIVASSGAQGLLVVTAESTGAHQARLRQQLIAGRSSQRFLQLYSLFIPVVDPDVFLGRTLGLFRLVANRWVGGLLLLLAPGAIYLLVAGLPRIEAMAHNLMTFEGLVLLWVTITITKILHELSHAYTAKLFGLRVPEMGIAFLVFFPCLYCDTTDAWRLTDRRKRVLVSAAGILTEGSLAVLATYVWYFTRDGELNSLAFYMMAVSFVSTVVVNANPLIRRDGYFVFSDALDLPNLGTRSQQAVHALVWGTLMGDREAVEAVKGLPRPAVHIAYGLASSAYRYVLTASIILLVYRAFDKLIGALLAAVTVVVFIVNPALASLRRVWSRRASINPSLGGLAAVGLIGGLVVLAAFTPFSFTASYPSYLAARQSRQLSMPITGTVTAVHVREGQAVRAGQRLSSVDTREFELALMKVNLELDSLQLDIESSIISEEHRAKVPTLQARLSQVREDVAHARRRLDLARVGLVATFDGVLTAIDARLAPGYRPAEGVVIGLLESSQLPVVRALIPARDRHLVTPGQAASTWLPIEWGRRIHTVVRQVHSFTETDLRESPLAAAVGGDLATEVRTRSGDETPLEDYFLCVLDPGAGALSVPMGVSGRTFVRLPPRSIIGRLADLIMRTINRENLL